MSPPSNSIAHHTSSSPLGVAASFTTVPQKTVYLPSESSSSPSSSHRKTGIFGFTTQLPSLPSPGSSSGLFLLIPLPMGVFRSKGDASQSSSSSSSSSLSESSSSSPPPPYCSSYW
eukprot:CAMPEP_0175100500 /NCGR_PEP_ID=MMETSP0086_2-20121207/7148_1 /TAXON_ID=136419 /ORGANISM="Unknown Unknown, Strain D1" /LENGTH=115 /DNA_ID=CAMNT_0016374671 /DNA_START=77 /DNA_END=421 /DNA_ORIENTATION=-